MKKLISLALFLVMSIVFVLPILADGTAARRYTVTVRSSDRKYIDLDEEKYYPGETVTVVTIGSDTKYVQDLGYYYSKNYDIWDYAEDEGDGVFTFTMPEYNVTLEPLYAEVDDGTRKITCSYDKKMGSVEISHTKAEKGDTVYFYIEPKSGYEVDEVYFMNLDELELLEYEYDRVLDRYIVEMPDGRLDCEIDFSKKSGSTRYSVDLVFDEELGDVELSKDTVGKGTKVYIYVYPERGAELDSIRVRTDGSDTRVNVSEDGDGEYYFTMPECDVTVFAELVEKYEGAVADAKKPESDDTEAVDEDTAPVVAPDTEVELPAKEPQVHICPAGAYTDIDAASWYHEAVDYVIYAGLMGGYSEFAFGPHDTTTRAMIATVLWRMEGSPSTGAEYPFSDVAAGEWYTDAVIWAAEKGIVNGIGGDLFDPTGEITREQLAAMVYRYAMSRGDLLFADTLTLDYPDAADTSDWASVAMVWCNSSGAIYIRDGRLLPKAPAERAEVAYAMMTLATDN